MRPGRGGAGLVRTLARSRDRNDLMRYRYLAVASGVDASHDTLGFQSAGFQSANVPQGWASSPDVQFIEGRQASACLVLRWRLTASPSPTML